jgi:hypothetical protein
LHVSVVVSVVVDADQLERRTRDLVRVVVEQQRRLAAG